MSGQTPRIIADLGSSDVSKQEAGYPLAGNQRCDVDIVVLVDVEKISLEKMRPRQGEIGITYRNAVLVRRVIQHSNRGSVLCVPSHS